MRKKVIKNTHPKYHKENKQTKEEKKKVQENINKKPKRKSSSQVRQKIRK